MGWEYVLVEEKKTGEKGEAANHGAGPCQSVSMAPCQKEGDRARPARARQATGLVWACTRTATGHFWATSPCRRHLERLRVREYCTHSARCTEMERD